MNIEKVVRDNKCRSCGYCFSVCPVNAIDMIYNDVFFRPAIKTDQCVQCGKCENCLVVNEFTETGMRVTYTDLLLAHSTNHEVRYNATSGGVINSLVHFFIETAF